MSPTERAALAGAFIFGAIAALAVLRWMATLGDRKWAGRRDRVRLATPWAPPVNARPNDFDPKGRPY